VYHHEWWNTNISKRHPIFTSRVVSSGIIERLKTHVIGKETSGRCQMTGMTATGLPPHIDLYREIERLCRVNDALILEVNSLRSDIMDELPMRVTNSVIAHCNVKGGRRITLQMFEAAMQKLSWAWGGRMDRPVPIGWRLPKTRVKEICELFHFGIINQNIRPFRKIKGSWLDTKDKSMFTKASKVYETIVKIAIEGGYHPGPKDEFEKISIPDWDDVFQRTYHHIISYLNTLRSKPISRVGDISYLTFYDWLKESTNNVVEL